MESCSLFQDLSFSIEIAAHDAGLEHYNPHMYFDAIAVTQSYHECFVPEEWTPPFNVHAEIEFTFSSLDTARAQLPKQAMSQTLGIGDHSAVSLSDDAHSPLMINLKTSFILNVSNLVPPSSQWEVYRHKVTTHEQLEAGMENLERKLQRALEIDDKHSLAIASRTSLDSIGKIVLCEFLAVWEIAIKANEEEAKRQQVLKAILRKVCSGVNVVGDFAQEITKDFASSLGHLI